MLPPAEKVAGTAVRRPTAPALSVPKVEPARSEADALTIFGARGEPAPRRRGFTLLHAAAAALAAGVLFAAYDTFTGGPEETGVVSLEDIATGAIDPLADASDDTGDAASDILPPEGRADAELAAVDPSVPVVPTQPALGAVSEPAEVEAPRSALSTPVDLPAPVAPDVDIALASPEVPEAQEPALGTFTPPPPPGTVFDMDERGLVRPTEDGAITPKGVLVLSGRPEILPPGAALGQTGDPEPVPDTPTETEDATALDDALRTAEDTPAPMAVQPDLPRTRPLMRPQQAEVVEAPAVAVVVAEDAGPDTPRPAARPASVAEAVAADAAASRDFDALAREARLATTGAGAEIASTAPRAAQPPPPEPEGRANVSVQPSLPTRASVADRATVKNALSLNRVNLIGVYGTASDRRALIRLPTGRYVKVKVGDRVDGGSVASIQSSSVEYVKGGQRFALTLPKG